MLFVLIRALETIINSSRGFKVAYRMELFGTQPPNCLIRRASQIPNSAAVVSQLRGIQLGWEGDADTQLTVPKRLNSFHLGRWTVGHIPAVPWVLSGGGGLSLAHTSIKLVN